MRIKNWRIISFSIIREADGRWRNSIRKTLYHTRVDAWCAGMKVVRHKLNKFELDVAGPQGQV